METLRISFLSGSVLELAATIGVALVAVTAGVRLVDGSLGLQAGLTVIVLAPELYLPFRRLGAEYHASADGLAVAERMFALLDAPGGRRRRRPAARAEPGAASRCALERVSFSYPARPVPVLDGFDLELVARRGRGARRRERRRQEHGRGAVARAAVADRRSDHRRRTSTCPSAGSTPGGGSSPGCPSIRRCSAPRVADNIRLGDPEAIDGGGRARPRCSPAPTSSSAALPDGYATLVGDGERSAVARRAPADRARAGVRAGRAAGDPRRADRRPRPRAASPIVAGAVRRLRAGRTMLVIAHRPELVQSADRVVRLIDGAAVAASRSGARHERRHAPGAAAARAACRAGGWRGRRCSGALTVVFGVGLMATAGYLISRAAERPPILSLMVAIVAVQFFGIGRPVVRYLERLASHDMTLRVLGGCARGSSSGSSRWRPAELDALPQGGPALADGRRRRRAPEPVPARPRAAAGRAAGRRRRRSAWPARVPARGRGSCSPPACSSAGSRCPRWLGIARCPGRPPAGGRARTAVGRADRVAPGRARSSSRSAREQAALDRVRCRGPRAWSSWPAATRSRPGSGDGLGLVGDRRDRRRRARRRDRRVATTVR